MGSGFSTFSSDDLAAFEIQNTIKELIKKYSIWSNPEKCNKMELVYKNKLLGFSDSQLYEVGLLLGYKSDKQIPREKICNFIVSHYKKRIDLLKKINIDINKCADMLVRVREGEFCKNTSKNVTDFFLCNAIPKTMWINKKEYKKLLEKLAKSNRLEPMMKWINNLEKYYYSSLNKLLRIVTTIKQDIDNTLSFIEFEAIENETDIVLKDMLNMCEIYYLLSINSSR
jgi:hypothetical protein